MATQEKLGYKKVATIYDEIDVYATSSNETLRTVLETNGVEILIEETFQTGDTDFSQQLTNIMAMAPDALFISALSQEIAGILAQTPEVGFPDTIQVIAPDLTMDELQKAGEGAEGTIGFIGWSSRSNAPGNQAFVRNYRRSTALNPNPGRHSRMRPSTFSPMPLRQHNRQIRPPFGTRSHRRRIFPQFWAN